MRGVVYAIQNDETGVVYIGSTFSLGRRWGRHRSALRRGCHGNAPLQADWTAFGPDVFSFQVLETVDGDRSALEAAEQRWLDDHSEQTYNRRRAQISGSQKMFMIRVLPRELADAQLVRDRMELDSLSESFRWAIRNAARELRGGAGRSVVSEAPE